MPGPLLAVDAPSLLFRAFYALPDTITDGAGRPVNALLGTANLILREIEEHSPRAVVLCFGLYRGGRRYEIHLERFADAVTLDRRDREASVRPWVERYARRLEHHCRAAPYNWFNFYDYWA